MGADARAATLVEPGRLEVRSYPVPSVDDGGAILDVEVCALCGTDASQFHGTHQRPGMEGPLIPGHEVVGRIRDGHPDTLRSWGIEVGDRVVIEPNLPCGRCAPCVTGRYVSCEGVSPPPMAFGFTPVAVPPALWGGYAEVMYLPARTVLHRVPDDVSAREASLTNVVANAFNWTCATPGLQYGDRVLVLGAGQRGLACVAVARASGASQILTTGLSTDARRLEAARSLGADLAVTVDEQDVVTAVRDATDGEGVDVVIDCTAGATQPVLDAIRAVRPGGTVVLAGMKHGRTVDGFPSDDVVTRQIRIVGALSAGYDDNVRALQFLRREGKALAELRTHELPLDQAAEGIALLAGERPEAEPIYISLGIGV